MTVLLIDEQPDTSRADSFPSTSAKTNENDTIPEDKGIVRSGVWTEICKQVVRCKLAKRRHLVIKEAIDPIYLDSIFPSLLNLFEPQHVTYNGGVANVKDWKISCYLEVMDGGVPTTHPNLELKALFLPILSACNDLFLHWYRQQHSCNTNNNTLARRNTNNSNDNDPTITCRRLMTFITRYTPAPGEQALLKVSHLHKTIYGVWDGLSFPVEC